MISDWKLSIYLLLVANVTDRNGSLETNEPSSPEESNNSDSINVQSPRHNNLFDFNEFFKLENLPGLHVSVINTLLNL